MPPLSPLPTFARYSCERHVYGLVEKADIEQFLDKSLSEDVDIVIIGCPNATMKEIREAADAVSGKTLAAELWVFTSPVMRVEAEKLGLAQIIRDAGGMMISESCTATMPPTTLSNRGRKAPATNSSKMVYYLEGHQKTLAHYGSTQRCLQAAITGKWV